MMGDGGMMDAAGDGMMAMDAPADSPIMMMDGGSQDTGAPDMGTMTDSGAD
jgi:hypothetical protein